MFERHHIYIEEKLRDLESQGLLQQRQPEKPIIELAAGAALIATRAVLRGMGKGMVIAGNGLVSAAGQSAAGQQEHDRTTLTAT